MVLAKPVSCACCVGWPRSKRETCFGTGSPPAAPHARCSADGPTMRKALHDWGLKGREHQLARHLSQGQRRRVALSRLALGRAHLWVLDEPFVAMDDAGVRFLADRIAAHL